MNQYVRRALGWTLKVVFFYALAASADELHRNANLSASAHAFMTTIGRLVAV